MDCVKPPVSGRWRLYGLNVDSDLPLPCLPASGDGTDLTIRWRGSAPRLLQAPSSLTRTWTRESRGWILRYAFPDGIFLEFLMEPDGSAVSISHHSPLDWPDFLMVLLGPALGAVLHLRKTPVLHGGAVIGEGGAVLLLSTSGAGKSTLTAALVNAGRPFLCEEVAALSLNNGVVFVQPGHSFLKLSPGAVKVLGKSPETLPLVMTGFPMPEERWLDARTLKGGHHDAAAPLRAVYLLSGRRAGLRRPRIDFLSPAKASIALGKHFYGRPWLSLSPEETLRLSAQIAGAAPVKEVWTPEGIASINATAEALMEDLGP